jgi:hypothetical protein
MGPKQGEKEEKYPKGAVVSLKAEALRKAFHSEREKSVSTGRRRLHQNHRDGSEWKKSERLAPADVTLCPGFLIK